MADTTTPNYALVKPEPGASDNTWGIKINSDLDIIDTKIKLAIDNAAAALAAAANAVQVGTIQIHGNGGSVPGFLYCDGTTYSRVGTYAALFAKIGIAFGDGDGVNSFNVPDFRGVFPRGVDGGRGLDAGRAAGSYQADDYKAHSHEITAGTGTHNHTGVTIAATGGTHDHGSITTSAPTPATHNHGYTWLGGSGTVSLVNQPGGYALTTTNTDSDGNHTHVVDLPTGGAHGHTITWPTTPTGGHDHTINNSPTTGGLETRPKNVAVYFFIKY